MKYKKRYEEALELAVINQREIDRLLNELWDAQHKAQVWKDFATKCLNVALRLADNNDVV